MPLTMTSLTTRIGLVVILMCVMLLIGAGGPAGFTASSESAAIQLTPAFLELEDGHSIPYEEGLLLVPENRHTANSRTIAVHFRRFPAQKGVAGLPVFYLPGGPGSTLDLGELAAEQGQEIIRFFTSVGDLVIVDQRGNSNVDVPFVPKMEMDVTGVELNRPGDPDALVRAYRAGYLAALKKWRTRGVDLAGYDILNAVDDVYDLSSALGYQRIILRGNSFGSQWSLAFMKRHPQRVARALLGGIEPLNHAYDRPADVWRAHQRIIRLAETDPDLEAYLPEEGFELAIYRLLDRLEARPERIVIPRPDASGMVAIVLGRHDLQHALKRFSADYYTRDGLKLWPRFILEMMDDDFRYLAALTYRTRQADRIPLIFPLIDNSLGITAERDRALRDDASAQIVGPINGFYYATRDLSPTPDVGDDFRADISVDVPVLMVQGDLDRSTPIENAQHLHALLPNSHLLYVENGTHMAIQEVRLFHPEVTAQVRAFLRTGEFGELPTHISIPPPDFEAPGDISLFQQLAADTRIPE